MSDDIRRVLGARPWWGALVAVPLTAVLAGVLAHMAASAFGVEAGIGWFVGGALVLFALLEVDVRRQGARRAGPARVLVTELVDRLRTAGEPGSVHATWRAGLPVLRGLVRARPFVVHFEVARRGRLRVVVLLETAPPAQLWLISRQPEDFPQRWVGRATRRGAVREVPDAPPATLALSVDPEAAAALLSRPDFVAPALTLVNLNAPVSAMLDLQSDVIGWDTLLTDRVDGGVVFEVLAGLDALPRAEEPADLGDLGGLSDLSDPTDQLGDGSEAGASET